MADNFNAAVDALLNDEGDAYVPDDNGRGPSKWGITFKTAYADQFLLHESDIQTLTRDQAAAFYRMYFWNPQRMYSINDLSVATKVLDLCVNIGEQEGIILLQRSLNTNGADLTIDGQMGPKTLAAINAQDPAALLTAYRSTAKVYYEDIVAGNPKLAGDLDGWLRRLDT